MSTNEEQYDNSEDTQKEEAELFENELEEAAGGTGPGGGPAEEIEETIKDVLEDWLA